jgi:nucleotidyltransferase-like protein
MTPESTVRLSEIVAKWVRRNANTRALGMVGSWARGNPRPDSDLDLLILARNPELYFTDDSLLAKIGFATTGYQVLSRAVVDYGARRSHKLGLSPDAAVELIFAPLNWANFDPVEPGSARIARDGLCILVDKDRLFSRLFAVLGLREQSREL